MNATFTKEQLRQKRHQLYPNPVFLVTHEALRPLLRSLDIVELFIFAEQFTQGLLQHPPTDSSLMEYEVDDLREDLAEGYAGKDIDTDCQLLLTLSLVILYAQRHTHALARPLSKVLLPFCVEYEGFKDLLGTIIVKEQELRRQGKITFQKRKKPSSMASTEPSSTASTEPSSQVSSSLATTDATPSSSLIFSDGKSPSSQQSPLSAEREFVERLVSNCENLTAEAIQHILVPLMTTNKQYGNAFDEQLDRLTKKLGMKTTSVLHPHVEGDFVVEKHVAHEVSGVEKDGIGIIIKKMG